MLLISDMRAERRVYFFERFAILAPVISGSAFAPVNLALRQIDLLELTFDTTL